MFPSLFAQAPTPAPTVEVGPLPWVIAFLMVVAVLTIVCMPSRKA
jgi:hypothetical protein